jgi:hypothetical protein
MTALNIPIDAAAARLRAASYTVEKQGMLWRVAAPGAEMAIASADEVRALALGLGDTTAALSPAMQHIARDYIAARARAGESLLTAARYLADARANAKHGEWGLFLEATNTSEGTAKRWLDIHDTSVRDAQFADGLRSGRLTFTVAAELAQPSTPPALIAAVLEADKAPTVATVRAAKASIKSAIVAEMPTPPVPETKPTTTTTTTARTCECGQPGTIEDNIAGISGWWCEACATTEERGDLLEQLGPQYRGESGKVRYGRILHSIRWDGGPVGDYTYHDALDKLHERSTAERKQPPALAKQLAPPPDPPIDPRAAAVAWRSHMQTMLAQCPDSTSFRKSEMQAALAHVSALLALLSAKASDTDDMWAVLGDLLLSDERARLMACRGALDAIVAEPVIDTDVYDALSRRIGDEERRLIEQEQAV